MKVIEKLIETIRNAGNYNKNAQSPPRCILWPDKNKEWEPIIPHLQTELPELLAYGSYNPSLKTGPAIWLKCAIHNKIPNLSFPSNHPPILYLPNISLSDLKPNNQCHPLLSPLVELQFTGQPWTQPNDRDWTVKDFLESPHHNLNLHIPFYPNINQSILRSLPKLLDQDLLHLQNKTLDPLFFDQLTLDNDWITELLLFLDNNQNYKNSHSPNQWKSFTETCSSQLSFNPDLDDISDALTQLANQTPLWKPIWKRFSESHPNTPNIPKQIRLLPFKPSTNQPYPGWPQWNSSQENSLRNELDKMTSIPHTLTETTDILQNLNELHKNRRSSIWSDLDEAPLAHAVETLAIMADTIRDSQPFGSLDNLQNSYSQLGWEIDSNFIKTLSFIENPIDLSIITKLLETLYIPWANQTNLLLQELIQKNGYPSNTPSSLPKLPTYNDSECILFIDGLRFDQAKLLSQLLENHHFHITETPYWSPLPSITATCKPAISPIRHLLTGSESSTNFEPSIKNSNQTLNSYLFHKLLLESGWETLSPSHTTPTTKNAWTEYGNTDSEGHSRGWKLAKYLPQMLQEITNTIKQLSNSGWKKIHLVTDHGWLLFPGGLPKTDLHNNLTDTKWSRCALVKPEARSNQPSFPWFWNPEKQIALAQGIACFRQGTEYTHGGLSFQECLTLHLTITPSSQEFTIASISWKGLRCLISLSGNTSNLLIDIRTKPNLPNTSITKTTKLNSQGTASIIIKDYSLEGQPASLVVLDETEKPIYITDITIGGEK